MEGEEEEKCGPGGYPAPGQPAEGRKAGSLPSVTVPSPQAPVAAGAPAHPVTATELTALRIGKLVRDADPIARLRRELDRTSTRLSDIAMGRLPKSPFENSLSELQKKAAGGALGSLVDRATAGGGLGSLVDRAAAGGVFSSPVGRAASGQALGAAGGLAEALRRQNERMGAGLGGRSVSDMIRRHTALSTSVEAMGGISSIISRHQALQGMLPASRLAASGGLAAYRARSMTSGIDRALRELSGVTSFTGMVDRARLDQERLGSLVSGTLAWQRSARGLSLSATLRSQAPELFPERRLATAADLSDITLGPVGRRLVRTSAQLDRFRAEMLGIRLPWVEADRPERSVGAYVEARALAVAVETRSPVSRAVVDAVRAELGDYRGSEPVSEVVASDPVLSSALRIEIGFNPDLSSLPPAVMAAIFGPFGGRGQRTDVDPDALASVVHQRARRLELRLRRFIEQRMMAAYGPRWTKRQVHGDTVKRWRQRRQLDLDNGRTASRLFDYAGFEDYREIIEKADNWRDVFAPVFPLKTSLLEALRRLSLVRNPDAHYRLLTIDDLLDLTVEGRRLDRWMDGASTAGG